MLQVDLEFEGHGGTQGCPTAERYQVPTTSPVTLYPLMLSQHSHVPGLTCANAEGLARTISLTLFLGCRVAMR
jgi:hypothetical protein